MGNFTVRKKKSIPGSDTEEIFATVWRYFAD